MLSGKHFYQPAFRYFYHLYRLLPELAPSEDFPWLLEIAS